MLQQTQVATVVPYFHRFVLAFPDLQSLAAAELGDVLRLWQGLGYYRRARDLHAAARVLVAEHGCFPNNPEAIGRLPGMGRYTVGAVLSQAFDCRLPIVESNSQRVLCRLFGQRHDPSQASTRRWLWRTAEMLLPRKQVGDFNQALMELGALVCLPAGPRCSACPLSAQCVAHRLGLQSEIPTRRARRETIAVNEVAVVIRRGSRLLLVQRTTAGRWPGLWEFPHDPVKAGETLPEAVVRLARDLAGMAVEPGPELVTLRHSVTHHRITLNCLEARHSGGRFRSGFYQRGTWVRLESLGAFPLSSPQRRLARAISRHTH
jgi:A/G-specific adenine glycosylase